MPSPEQPLLKLTGVVKTFPGVRALDGVELEVQAGEVHCVPGQNGAGKSTLIKVPAGVHKPNAGSVLWRGEEVSFGSPQAATKAGIATTYQELDLVDDLTVAENIFLGHEQSVAGFVRRKQMRTEATAVLNRLGHGDISAGRTVGKLPAAAKQIVSMGRALSHDAQLLVMDEPSAVLAHDEVANLFRVIRDLTSRGIAIIYITHRLEEIREIGDRVTVPKDGRTAAVNLPARTTTASVVALQGMTTSVMKHPGRHPVRCRRERAVMTAVAAQSGQRDEHLAAVRHNTSSPGMLKPGVARPGRVGHQPHKCIASHSQQHRGLHHVQRLAIPRARQRPPHLVRELGHAQAS